MVSSSLDAPARAPPGKVLPIVHSCSQNMELRDRLRALCERSGTDGPAPSVIRDTRRPLLGTPLENRVSIP